MISHKIFEKNHFLTISDIFEGAQIILILAKKQQQKTDKKTKKYQNNKFVAAPEINIHHASYLNSWVN